MEKFKHRYAPNVFQYNPLFCSFSRQVIFFFRTAVLRKLWLSARFAFCFFLSPDCQKIRIFAIYFFSLFSITLFNTLQLDFWIPVCVWRSRLFPLARWTCISVYLGLHHESLWLSSASALLRGSSLVSYCVGESTLLMLFQASHNAIHCCTCTIS